MSGVSPEVVQAERSFSLSVCVRQLHYSPAASKESLSEHIALQVCKALLVFGWRRFFGAEDWPLEWQKKFNHIPLGLSRWRGTVYQGKRHYL